MPAKLTMGRPPMPVTPGDQIISTCAICKLEPKIWGLGVDQNNFFLKLESRGFPTTPKSLQLVEQPEPQSTKVTDGQIDGISIAERTIRERSSPKYIKLALTLYYVTL